MDLTEIFDMVVTYHEKCSTCSSPTIMVDIPELHGRRICLQCLLDQVDFADTDAMANLEFDFNEAQEQLDVCTEGYDKLEKDADDLRSQILDLQGELEVKENLVEAATQECDALRKKTAEFDDDNIATQNKNAQLKFDVQKLKEHVAKHGQS